MKYINRLNKFLHDFLDENQNNIILGEDISDPYGGAFKATKGLSTKFKNQVISTPISESAIAGLGIGMMLKGHKVILEIMFGDFVTLCVDQFVNGASKFIDLKDTKSLGTLIIRCPMGGYRGYGPTHSQCLESLFFNIPNINIFSPNIFSDPYDVYSSALKNKGISIIVEHKISYSKDIEIKKLGGFDLDIVKEDSYDKVSILNKSPDYLILTYGHVAKLAVDIVQEIFIEKELIGEVMCIKKIKPINTKILSNLNHTKIITLEEGVVDSGWGRILSSYIYENNKSKVNILNLGAKNTIIPSDMLKELDNLPTIKNTKPKIIKFLNFNN